MPHLTRDGFRIWYEAHGSGPAVLLTHGYGATSGMWKPQISALGDRWRLIVWDIRGHGQSDSVDDPAAYNVEASVEDMAAILDACGVDRAVVGGHSLGGYLSLEFHLRHVERVRALMLFDSGPGYRNEQGRKEWNGLAESTARALDERGLEALGRGAEVRAARHRSACGLALAARGILAQSDARVIESLPATRVPALVLWGELDRRFVKPGEYMAAKIPGAVRAVIPGAGHAANLDQPEAFDRAVAEFLGSV